LSTRQRRIKIDVFQQSKDPNAFSGAISRCLLKLIFSSIATVCLYLSFSLW